LHLGDAEVLPRCLPCGAPGPPRGLLL